MIGFGKKLVARHGLRNYNTFCVALNVIFTSMDTVQGIRFVFFSWKSLNIKPYITGSPI